MKAQTTKLIYRADFFFRLIGWSRADEALIFAYYSEKSGLGRPVTVKLSSVSVKTGDLRQIAELPLTYYLNMQLAPDRRTLAYVAHQEERDNLWVLPLTGGRSRKLTANQDQHLYFSSLAWSPDSQTIYFGKQSRYSRLSMLTNF